MVRYHVCTTDQLLALGIIPGNRQDQRGGTTSSVDAESLGTPDIVDQEQLSTDDADTNAGAEDLRPHTLSPGEGTWMAQRISIPPSQRLTATTSTHEPSSPVKKLSHPKDSLESVVLDRSTSLKDLHPAFGRFVVGTSSPGTAVTHTDASASPEEIQSARPNALQVLKGVFDSALRRRTSPMPFNGASTSSLSATSSMGSLNRL